MLTIDQLKVLYSCMLAYQKNPRISDNQLHRNLNAYRNRQSTNALLHRAREYQILLGPYVYANTGISIFLHKNKKVSLELYDKKRSDPDVNRVMMLFGEYSLLCFQKGTDDLLRFAEAIIPSFPARKTIDDLVIERIGKLKDDPFPAHWSELDWKVFNHMKDPSIPYFQVGQKLGFSFMTIKAHWLKIFPDCKTWLAFFPRGYKNYYPTILIFNTDYEIGFKEELQDLDRTSYLYKFDDTLILIIFLDEVDQIHTFYEMEKEGMIENLAVSVPFMSKSTYW